MNKKFFVSLAVLLCLVFSFSMCFATNELRDAADGVRNFVGGVEDKVENAAKDVSNASKDATGSIENGMNSSTDNKMSNGITTNNNNNNGHYNATRTSNESTTIMGMTSTGWTWLIIGIAAIAIIAVVWYYSMQFTNKNRNDD